MAKLISWILGGTQTSEIDNISSNNNDEDSGYRNEEELGPSVIADEDVNETVSGTGVISLLDDCIAKGVINGTYLFDKSKFTDLKLKRGMNVTYTAIRSNGCWSVTDLEPVLSEKRQAIVERSQYLTVNYKVVEIYDSHVMLSRGNDDSPIQLDNTWLPKDFPVWEGDWLEVRMKAVEDECTASGGEISQANILAVNWTEQTIAMGTVIKHENRICIDGIIFFTLDVVENQQILKVNDKVRFVAVASDQEYECSYNRNYNKRNGVIFKKRACAVTISQFMKYPPPQKNESSELSESEWVEDEPVDELDEKFKELFRDKNGIRINPNRMISFKALKVGSPFQKTVTVENTNSSRMILDGIHLANCQDVCKFELILDRTEGNAVTTLLPSVPFIFKITCTPQQLGRTKELCIFDFGDFKIARWLSVTAISEDEEAIKSMRQMGHQRDWKKERAQVENASLTMMQQQNMRVIRGAQAVRTPFFLPHRVPPNSIPKHVLKIYQKATGEDLIRAFPNMQPHDWTVLNSENYLTRFQVSLWFEEIENDSLRRQYDMRNIILRCAGESLVFEVPGLKEFHPPILQGDPVKCMLSKEPECVYQGTVQKIYSSDSTQISEVYVKFNEKFHRTYDGCPVIIQFCLGRTTFKRQHFAITHAMDYLGKDWLFPEVLVLRPPRIHFIEDPNDNVHSAMQSRPVSEHPQPVQLKQLNSLGRNDRRAPSMPRPFESNVQDPSDLGIVKLRWFNTALNEEQKNAVRRILTGSCRPLPYIIFGPPGTGKTVTVVEAILQIYTLEKSSRILVTVPSNAGADVIAEHLVATNLFKPGDFVRLNGFIRSEIAVPETIADFCVDGEFLDSVAKHRLIISTVNTAGQFFQLNLNTGHFSHVFIDEAGYCTEPEAMIAAVLVAVAKEGQIILAGDPKQLGPVLMCDLSVNSILAVSFLERLMNTNIYARNEHAFPDTKYNPAVLTKLVQSYRAHKILLKLPSAMFYDDELVSCASHSDAYELCDRIEFPKCGKRGVPLLFHGCQGTCLQDSDSPSWYNLAEVFQIVKYVKVLRSNGLSNDDIGIITPYRKQVDKVRNALSFHLLEDELPKIASVQEFQGGERKVMIISTVRSDYEDMVDKKLSRLDFLYSKKRFNVAVTRAKAFMIIIGNPHVLFYNPCWEQLLRYSIELGVYTGCDLPRQLDPKWDKLLVNDVHVNGSRDLKNCSAPAGDDYDSYEMTTSTSVDLFG